jgi:hypothetical protein
MHETSQNVNLENFNRLLQGADYLIRNDPRPLAASTRASFFPYLHKKVHLAFLCGHYPTPVSETTHFSTRLISSQESLNNGPLTEMRAPHEHKRY